jgi:site-specific DNA recombinase
VPSKSGGKEPLASVVQQGLEGFASGHFASQAELKRFYEASPHFPKDLPSGEIRTETIRRLLSKVLYAGYLEAPSWGVSRRKAHHEGMITLEMWEHIQQRRQDFTYLPARKDIHKDFILRGAVCCASCGHSLSSAWSHTAPTCGVAVLIQKMFTPWMDEQREDGQEISVLFLPAP